MPAISVAIIAKDEAERLRACVTSCRPFADEVVVVDAGSTDGTVNLAGELGCVVVESEWRGYGPQRNVAAEAASHDWIFWIDADEVVGPDLARSLVEWKDGGEAGPAAMSVERVGDFLGRWVTGAAEWMVRLYDRRACRISDDVVHERVLGCENPGRLVGRLWHYGFRSLSDHTVRFDRYTTLEAEKAWDQGVRFSWLRLLWRPPARFLHVLVRRRMYREGAAGVAIAFDWLHYDAMRELKLREREWAEKGRRHDPIP
jgi:glycosyltransferase involved in cell wall biosynthesis